MFGQMGLPQASLGTSLVTLGTSSGLPRDRFKIRRLLSIFESFGIWDFFELLPAARLVNMCCFFPSHDGCLFGGKVMFSFLGNLGTPHTWGTLISTWGPLIPGDPSYLGTPHTWGLLIYGDPSYLGTHHTREPIIAGGLVPWNL